MLGVTQTLRAFEDGLASMRVGGLRRMQVPPEYALGGEGQVNIPPNSTLVIEVELLEVRDDVGGTMGRETVMPQLVPQDERQSRADDARPVVVTRKADNTLRLGIGEDRRGARVKLTAGEARRIAYMLLTVAEAPQ